ncbi:MAG TPA: replicative DNA helicase [Paludibacteraceae bacterium]|nr:replicative DNA helicase [Paludibacteraceae bacterium]
MEKTKKPRKKEPEYGKVPQYVVSEYGGKLPPQAIELEEVVLGALMLEKDAYVAVCEFLKKECFYKDVHQTIYEAITNLSLNQEPVDLLTVSQQLKRMGKLEEVGGQSFISELTGKVASAANIEYHAQIIVQKYLSRELIRISSDIQKKAYDEKQDVDELMQDAEGQLFEITQRNLKKDVTHIQPVISKAIDLIEIAANKQDGYTGIPSGFNGIDTITSGWQKSDLIIIAARPAMGKTAFVLSMAKNMALDYEHPVAVFSLEMSNIQLVNRLIVNVAEIEGDKIKRGKLAPFEWEQLRLRTATLQKAPIFVDDTPSLSVFELRTKARRLVKEHKIQCIIIDYLQLMNASGMTYGSREQEVSIISRSLKGLAKELDIPIIALSQLNRGVEGRTGADKRPQLSDLCESGAIEQDADMVLFIHRPEYYKITQDEQGNDLRGKAEIIIAKHRNGSTGDVFLRFKQDFIKFTNLASEESYAEFQSKSTDSQEHDFLQANTYSNPSPF